ncbi:MAG: cytochrome c biogenesis protein ResB [Planctomycetota bacterium]|jgi:hypothetical protein
MYRPTFASCTLLLVLVWALAIAGGRVGQAVAVAPEGEAALPVGVAVALGALVAAVCWSMRRTLYLALTSLHFSIVLLAALMLGTVAGTLIVQNAQPEQYAAKYGESFGGLALSLGLDDIFHTLGFNALLGILMLSLLLVPVRNRAWQLPRWGHLGSHLGIVVILFGGILGNLGGAKGVLEMREGETADRFTLTNRQRAMLGPEALGFSLVLDDFSIEYYDQVYRLHVYTPRDEDRWEMTGSWEPEVDEDWTAIGRGGARFRVTKVMPDYRAEQVLREVPAGEGAAWFSATMEHDHGAHDVRLEAGAPMRDRVTLHGDDGVLRFAWNAPSQAELDAAAESRPARHLLDVTGLDGSKQTLEVEPGGRYELTSGEFVDVLEYFPHFTYDMETRSGITLSDRPENPTLRVAVAADDTVEAPKQWLFSKFPDQVMGHAPEAGGPTLRYRFVAGHAPLPREVLVVGSTREVLRLADGRLIARAPLDDGLHDLDLVDVRVLASAVEETVEGNRSDAWDNPVIHLELEDGAHAAGMHVLAGNDPMPLRLSDGSALVFERRGDDVRSYASTVAVVEDGQRVASHVIKVNEPLSWAGFKFYQSNYRKDDPTWTGLQVVKDPGLSVVFVGFVMLALGLTWVYTVRPWLLKRRLHA